MGAIANLYLILYNCLHLTINQSECHCTICWSLIMYDWLSCIVYIFIDYDNTQGQRQVGQRPKQTLWEEDSAALLLHGISACNVETTFTAEKESPRPMKYSCLQKDDGGRTCTSVVAGFFNTDGQSTFLVRYCIFWAAKGRRKCLPRCHGGGMLFRMVAAVCGG